MQKLMFYCGATLMRRSTGETPPCFYNKSNEFGRKQNLTELVQKVNVQISDLVPAVEDLIENMANYCVNAADVEGISFIAMEEPDIDDEKFGRDFCNNTTSFLGEMRYHYDTLSRLAKFVAILQTKAEATAREKLLTFQNSIYECMCKLQTAMRSHGHDPDAKVHGGNIIFYDFIKSFKEGKTRCEQQMLQYVVAMDSQRIANILKIKYSIFDRKPSAICDLKVHSGKDIVG